MANPLLFDRVKETTTVTGTGTATLSGATGNFRAFSSVIAVSGTVWYAIVDNVNSAWEVGLGVYTNSGTTLARNTVLASSNAGSLVSFAAGTKDVFLDAPAVSFPQSTSGYLDNMVLSNSVTTNTLQCAGGVCRDSTDVAWIILPSILKVLQTSGAWTSGTSNNGLDTGARANSTWYHVFAIAKPGGVSPDMLFSLSPTAPTLPTGWTLFRRVGSVKSDGSANFVSFFQDGDSFSWKARVSDVSAANPGTSAVTRTLSVPTGVRVRAKVVIGFGIAATADNPAGILITDLSTTDVAPSVADATVLCYSATVLISNFFCSAEVWTNTSAQVRSRLQVSATNTTLNIITAGWYDPRGKDGGA